MVVGLLGRKVGVTQVFDPSGEAIPVTVIHAGPCHVLQLRTQQHDGYDAVQLGYLNKPRRLASRAARGQVAKLDSKRQRRRAAAGVEPAPKPDCEPQRYVREFRGSTDGLTVGQELKVDIFSEIKSVDVIGTSKGRGTAGVMKRHGFKGQRATHGVKKVHRHAGSIGCNTDPHHVFKGRRMAGHMGAARCTARNLKVVRVDLENNLLLVRGAVPGPNGGYLMIRQTNKM
jgi:large subunit ribosomal protein L3